MLPHKAVERRRRHLLGRHTSIARGADPAGAAVAFLRDTHRDGAHAVGKRELKCFAPQIRIEGDVLGEALVVGAGRFKREGPRPALRGAQGVIAVVAADVEKHRSRLNQRQQLPLIVGIQSPVVIEPALHGTGRAEPPAQALSLHLKLPPAIRRLDPKGAQTALNHPPLAAVVGQAGRVNFQGVFGEAAEHGCGRTMPGWPNAVKLRAV